MKKILKVTLLSALFVLTSCAHYHAKCCKENGQCEMKKGCEKDQCPMVNEAAPAKKS